MRNYEIMFIVNPNTAEDEIDKINGQVEGIITAGGGAIVRIEKMGKRRLAYPVNKLRDGFYVLFVLTANGEIVREIERRLRVMDQVVKYLSVAMDEDIRRLDKIKAHRQKRAVRRGRGDAGTEGDTVSPSSSPSPMGVRRGAEQVAEES